MKKIEKITVNTFITQISFWVILSLVFPLLSSMASNTFSFKAILNSIRSLLPWMFIYFFNYFALVPFFLKPGKKWVFYLGNAVFVLFNVIRAFIAGRDLSLPVEYPISINYVIVLAIAGTTIFHVILMMLAVGSRYIEQYYILKEKTAMQQKEAAEAELVWLKSQLNPHFLFNTLNNISSLTQIDPGKAQESLNQFSDLLRYALYESDAELVPIDKEADFMNNYIDLMSLRCNEKTKVSKSFELPARDVKIAPLIFISLIENAFKHGVNARLESFVNVSMRCSGSDLLFLCENSYFEKSGKDRIGSGIGLNNLKKRLELIYPKSYEYKVSNENGIYSAMIIIKGIC